MLSTTQTVETADGNEDDELRESLENQLQGIKTRLSKVEDANGISFLMPSEGKL